MATKHRLFQPVVTTAPYRRDTYWGGVHHLEEIPDARTKLSRGAGSYTAQTTKDFQRRVRSGDFIGQRSYCRIDEDEHNNSTALQYYHDWERNPPVTDSVWGFTDEPPAAPFVLRNGEGRNSVQSSFLLSQVNETDIEIMTVDAISRLGVEVDALTELLEARQTIEMVRDAYLRARDLVRYSWKKGYWKNPPDFNLMSSRATSDWLQWRYGWRVLGYSIESIQEMLSNPFVKRNLTKKSSILNLSDEGKIVVPQVGSQCTYDKVSQWSWEMQVFVLASGEFAWNTHNYKITDVATTAWELTKFSFVADFFVNVGDTLAALHVLRQLQRRSASLNMTFTGRSSLSYTNVVMTGEGHVDLDVQSGYTCKVKQRIPIPMSVGIPNFRSTLDFSKVLDITALLRQRFKTKRK